MFGPDRDPFLRPGVAAEIEAQLRMQEERRGEAERLAKAEAEIARLRLNVRRGLFAIATLAAVTALVAAAFLADIFPHRLAKPAGGALKPLSEDSPPVSPARTVSFSKSGSPLTTRKAEDTMPERASRAGLATDAIGAVPASVPPSEVTPDSQPPSFTAPTAERADAQVGNPVPPVLLRATGSAADEYQIKAAFLVYFARFVRRPAGASSPANEVFTIGILGDDPFGNVLDTVLGDQRGEGMPFAIKRARDSADLRGAQMVFISNSERGSIQEILRSFADTKTLTVGETEKFTARGGMIEFTPAEDKIRFRVNLRALRTAGFAIDNRLLKVAIIDSQ